MGTPSNSSVECFGRTVENNTCSVIHEANGFSATSIMVVPSQT